MGVCNFYIGMNEEKKTLISQWFQLTYLSQITMIKVHCKERVFYLQSTCS